MAYSVEQAVKNLNDSYMKTKKNEFVVDRAYGGCKICITGKSKKVRGKWVWTGIGSGQATITSGYVSAKDTLAQLALILSNKNNFKKLIDRYENR